jgi:hypothetical protein
MRAGDPFTSRGPQWDAIQALFHCDRNPGSLPS